MKLKKVLKAKKRVQDYKRRKNIFKSERSEIRNGNRERYSISFPKSKKFKEPRKDHKETVVQE